MKLKLSIPVIIMICLIVLILIILCVFQNKQKDFFELDKFFNRLMTTKDFEILDKLITEDYRKKRLASNMPVNTRIGCLRNQNLYNKRNYIGSFLKNKDRKEKTENIIFTKNSDGTYSIRKQEAQDKIVDSESLQMDNNEYLDALCKEKNPYLLLEDEQDEEAIYLESLKDKLEITPQIYVHLLLTDINERLHDVLNKVLDKIRINTSNRSRLLNDLKSKDTAEDKLKFVLEKITEINSKQDDSDKFKNYIEHLTNILQNLKKKEDSITELYSNLQQILDQLLDRINVSEQEKDVISNEFKIIKLSQNKLKFIQNIINQYSPTNFDTYARNLKKIEESIVKDELKNREKLLDNIIEDIKDILEGTDIDNFIEVLNNKTIDEWFGEVERIKNKYNADIKFGSLEIGNNGDYDNYASF